VTAAGLGVTTEQLTGAADAIDAAVRGFGAARAGGFAAGRGGGVPAPAGEADYGHPGVAEAVVRFGAEVREATGLLLAGTERASTGLRADADAYLTQERATARGLGR
jgi:hypothetical protein